MRSGRYPLQHPFLFLAHLQAGFTPDSLHAFDVDLAAVAAQQRRDPPPSQGSGRQFQNPNLRSTDYSDSADYERFAARSLTDFPVQGPEQKVPSIVHLTGVICAISGSLVWGLSNGSHNAGVVRSVQDLLIQFERAGSLARKQVKSRTC